jgi:hypothetical protein
MTIDSSWIASFKEESPISFTNTVPFRPIAAFIDGQIRLMRGNTSEFTTWDNYIWQQFTGHLKRFFERASTVILAFDDYQNVPEAKCMTQLKRRKHLPKLEMLEREPLPSFLPSGERWDQCISNRVFKSKVILMVIDRVPGLLNLTPDQTLIIDYAGCPKEYRKGPNGLEIKDLNELMPLGEADVKFTRYADLFKDLLVDSVDGDSIPIALLHHEACFRDLTMGSMESDDLVESPPRICIYRITTRVDNIKKRSLDDKPKRSFEYVNIPSLYLTLRDVCAQCMDRMTSPSHSQHYMSMILALIGLTGTDFTRNMPQLSGRSVFALLPDIWMPLMASYNIHSGQLDLQRTDRLVATIYASKFANHVKSPLMLEHVLEALHRSKLSQRTKESLPSVERIICTIKNVNWLLKYWREPTNTPTPFLEEEGVAIFGFVKKRGLVGYEN